MLWRCVVRRKQTKRPPKRVLPLETNPLVRWSWSLPRWDRIPVHLSELVVGLEGCHSAFNASNAIRTCMFFGTAAPPSFLKLHGWQDIEHIQFCPSGDGNDGAHVATVSEAKRRLNMALFGEELFLMSDFAKLPIVALENFTPRSQSIFRTRFPFSCRLVLGHENLGIRPHFLFPFHKMASTSHRDTMEEKKCEESPKVRAQEFVRDWKSEDTCAKTVVYIPQYGTISSLNVVASLGIALFYAYLDLNFPHARTVLRSNDHNSEMDDNKTDLHTINDEGKLLTMQLRRKLRAFQSVFEESLPKSTGISLNGRDLSHSQRYASLRVDARPIHPNYYERDSATIKAMHRAYRAALLAYCEGEKDPEAVEGGPGSANAESVGHFGLSVLYENEFDQRNFGGIIRNANAFLVDHVFYIGRRKPNVVGSVGSYHYTPPTFLSPMPGAETVGDFSQALQHRVDAAYRAGAAPQFWFLDCGHGFLYASDFFRYPSSPGDALDSSGLQVEGVLHGCGNHFEDGGLARASTTTLGDGGDTNQGYEGDVCRSSLESLRWYLDHIFERRHVVSLCDPEEEILKSTGRIIDRDRHAGLSPRRPVVLVIPQEGKLPHIEVLRLCEGIITLGPFHERGEALRYVNKAKDIAANSVHRGLPIQVASGIALQRLSAVFHPRIQTL